MKKEPSYGRIKISTIGGIFMPREYRNISFYEKEILELREKGLTHKEIGHKLGFSQEQIKKYLKRYREKQNKIAAGIALKRKGRPPKNYVVSEEDKIAELKYILTRKDARIKTLEMENKLMRDFLLLAERK